MGGSRIYDPFSFSPVRGSVEFLSSTSCSKHGWQKNARGGGKRGVNLFIGWTIGAEFFISRPRWMETRSAFGPWKGISLIFPAMIYR